MAAQQSPFAQIKKQYGLYSAGEVGGVVAALPKATSSKD